MGGAEVGYDEVHSSAGGFQIHNHIVADLDAPLSENSLQTNVLVCGIKIKQRQQPATLTEVLIDFLDFLGQESVLRSGNNQKIAIGRHWISAEQGKRSDADVPVLSKHGGELKIPVRGIPTIHGMFAMALKHIGVERLGTGHPQESGGKHFFAEKLGGLAQELDFFLTGELFHNVLGQRISRQNNR